MEAIHRVRNIRLALLRHHNQNRGIGIAPNILTNVRTVNTQINPRIRAIRRQEPTLRNRLPSVKSARRKLHSLSPRPCTARRRIAGLLAASNTQRRPVLAIALHRQFLASIQPKRRIINAQTLLQCLCRPNEFKRGTHPFVRALHHNLMLQNASRTIKRNLKRLRILKRSAANRIGKTRRRPLTFADDLVAISIGNAANLARFRACEHKELISIYGIVAQLAARHMIVAERRDYQLIKRAVSHFKVPALHINAARHAKLDILIGDAQLAASRILRPVIKADFINPRAPRRNRIQKRIRRELVDIIQAAILFVQIDRVIPVRRAPVPARKRLLVRLAAAIPILDRKIVLHHHSALRRRRH